MAGFEWSGRREEAALLVAQDQLSNEAIAARVGVTRQSLDRWKRRPEFGARVEQLVAELREGVRQRGIVERENRVAALNDRWHRMRAVIEARAEEHRGVAGGESGLLVKTVRTVRVEDGGGTGRGKKRVDLAEYAVDGVLLRELREHEKQVAMELGQWAERQEHTGEVIVREYVGVEVRGV
jgi:hypothetical protein